MGPEPPRTEAELERAPSAPSWNDNDAVQALHDFADATDRLAAVLPGREQAIDPRVTLPDVELPIRNLPSHLQFARYWQERMGPYLKQTCSRSCPVCRGTEASPWFSTQDGYRYDICARCGVVYIPDVVPMEVWDTYFADLPDARASLESQMSASIASETETANRNRFGRYFDVLQRHGAAGRGARLLDIGTFTGGSLRVATERELDAFGVEGLQEAVRFTHAHFPERRVALSHAESIDPGLFGGAFDLVTMWETLEHTLDPMAVLAGAHSVMAPGGWLAVTVPNARNVQFSVLRDYCFYAYGGYQGVGHINMFTPDTLGATLDASGFDVVHVETEFGTDFRQLLYYLQHRFDRIYCYRNLVRRGEFTSPPEPALSLILNWLSPALTRLENACLAGPIILNLARRRA